MANMELNEYFKRPVPVLSDNNVQVICQKMTEGFDYFVEYGMGASTLYFSERFKALKATIISVENTIGWFRIVVQRFKSTFNIEQWSENITHLTFDETYSLIRKMDIENPYVPYQLSRRKRWKEALLVGPFYLFSPSSKSRFSRLLPWLFWQRPLASMASILYRCFSWLRPTYAEFKAQTGKLTIVLRNVPPAIKDQFGESPTKDDYINAGLSEIKEALLDKQRTVKAIFCIDGGPRGEIIRTILGLEESHDNFHPAIFLCDAHQAFYSDVIKSRPTGVFLAGSNRTINGYVVQNDLSLSDQTAMMYMFGKTKVSKEELAQKEIWFYEKPMQQVMA